jgi:hypothetical protein
VFHPDELVVERGDVVTERVAVSLDSVVGGLPVFRKEEGSRAAGERTREHLNFEGEDSN